MPVEAVRAEVRHSLLVAVVLQELGSLRQQPLGLSLRPGQQEDDLAYGLLNDVPNLRRNGFSRCAACQAASATHDEHLNLSFHRPGERGG